LEKYNKGRIVSKLMEEKKEEEEEACMCVRLANDFINVETETK